LIPHTFSLLLLDALVTSEEFRTFFETFGAVADSVVMMDRETNRSRGFGFVTFEDADVSERVLALGSSNNNSGKGSGNTSTHLEMRGKLVEIKSAEPKTLPALRGRAWRRGGAAPRKNWQPTSSLTATPLPVYQALPHAYYNHQYQLQQQQQQAYYPPNAPFIPRENDGYNNLAANYSASAYGYAAAPYSYYDYGYNYKQQQGAAYGYYQQQLQQQHYSQEVVLQANLRRVPDAEKNKEG